MAQQSSGDQGGGRSRHPNSWVLFDGAFLRYHDVHIPPMTHALHYGTGCFEGIRGYWNADHEQLYLLQAAPHFERLRRSARILRMELTYSTAQLVEWTLELLRRNDFRTDTYVRPLLYIASEEIGVRLHGMDVSLLIYATPMGNYIAVEHGIRCMTSTWQRIPDASIPARAKIAGSYVNSALAKSEAEECGFDEAIMLTASGHVSEGSAENLFMLKDGVFITPPVTDDILEGITRGLLMDLIRDELRLPVAERSIDRTELYVCDELLLCGTGAQVSPVVEVDRRMVGDGQVGRYARQLQDVYLRAVRGEEPRYAAWSQPVFG
ncbi:MAG: branched-chain amino acid transaminase [Chloroflexota bacterium]